MAEVTIRVCDVCESSEGVTTFRITRMRESRMLDLCARHQDPAEQLFKRGSKGARKVGPGRRTFDDAVTTLEDIAKRKASQNA